MKKSLLILFALLPTFLYAGVIVKQSGERLEDVTIKSVTDSEIIYVLNGAKTTLSKSEVSAILYDDGRYEEITYQDPSYNQKGNDGNEKYVTSYDESGTKTVIKQQAGSGAKEYNVCAYGVYAMFYVPSSKYDGATVEYRIIYKSQKETPEFTYLGTTPFAYLTEKMYNNNFTAKGDPNFQSLKELNPFIVNNAKNVKYVEFRLSKAGYKTVIVKPIMDAYVGGGPVMFISLNKLVPLKDGEFEEEPIVQPVSNSEKEPTYEQAVTSEPVYNEPTYEEPVYETPASEQQNASASSSHYEEPVYETPAPKQQQASESPSHYEEPVYEQAVEVAVKEKEEKAVVQTDISVREEPQISAVKEPETIFKADTKYLSFSSTGGSQQVHIEANCPWEIYSSPEWTEVQKSGDRLTIYCTANAQLSDREDDIILRIQKGETIRITVVQDKSADFLNLSANIVYENDGDGGRYIIHVRTNKPYQASTTAQWCHVNISADSLVLSVDENKSGQERQCEAEVRVSEQLKQTIYVKQAPLQHYVHVSPQIVTATQRGGTISIHVDSDEKWRVVNIPEWCQVSEQTNDSFLLEILPNDTGVSRTEVFSVSAYGTRQNITVKQE